MLPASILTKITARIINELNVYNYNRIFEYNMNDVLKTTNDLEDVLEAFNLFLDISYNMFNNKYIVNNLFYTLLELFNHSRYTHYNLLKNTYEFRNENEFCSEYLPVDVLINPTFYDVIRCNVKVLRDKNCKAFISFCNLKQITLTSYINLNDFIRKNFIETANLNDKELKDLLKRVDNKFINASSYLNSDYYRLLNFYDNLKEENKDSFYSKLHFCDLEPSYQGYLTDESFVFFHKQFNDTIHLSYVPYKNGISLNRTVETSIDKFLKIIDSEMKDFIEKDLYKLQAELLINELR